MLGVMALFNFEKFSTLKNGFRSITFERISVLDSYFIVQKVYSLKHKQLIVIQILYTSI